MRVALLLICLAPAMCAASPPEAFLDAWSYIAEKEQSQRWLVVASKKGREGYLECENLSEVVRCVIPVWTKKVPLRGRYLPVGGREKPYPEIPGSKHNDILTPSQLEKAQAVLKKYAIEPVVIYSKVKGEDLTIIGTQCDIRFILPLTYKSFESLAKEYLKDVYGIPESDGYVFETDG